MNFKKKVNGSWVDTPNYIHNTSTDTITTLPAVLYPTGTTATVGLKGNTIQSGIPTPDNPVMPVDTGDLETSGTKAGQYKIPISSANTTTPVYLGEVETTRRIKKFVLTGEENIDYSKLGVNSRFTISNAFQTADYHIGICSHYKYEFVNANNTVYHTSNNMASAIFIFDNNYTSAADFKAYLAAQYAAGTPVTIWYALATEETGIVNEPLMKIGEYVDSISGITIPATAGGDTLSVGTTVQPSEVTVNYKGWHPVANVHERENGVWT